jgi:hypothetical protein
MTGYQSKKDMAQAKLAQPAQEPTRPCRSCGGTGERFTGIDEAPTSICKPCNGTGQKALTQPAQEPVAWMYDWLCEGKLITGWISHSASEIHKLMASNIRPLYTSPPQRTWVGLTDEERDAITDKVIGFNSCCGWEDDYAKAIEAKLKERNA